MASNLTEYLSQLQELTQKNINILSTINDAFTTKQNHLTVNVDDNTSYIIPSFISIENKLNSLQQDFENLVNAPKTGEANFYFDGNSQTIQLKGYSNTPSKITLNPDLLNFSVNKNDIFKDFLTPEPYVRLYVGDISNDINHINVKKIVPKNKELLSLLQKSTAVANIDYKEVQEKLVLYKEDVDYIEYDTLKHMPLKENLGYGEYQIQEIISNETDENFDEYYTLRVDTLRYKVNNETIDKTLIVGDELVSWNDKVKLKITAINTGAKMITVRVMQGGYLNLVAFNKDKNINKELCTLKYLSSQSLKDVEKYIDVPLEEDQYVIIFVAPVNSQMMIQAPWGTGLFINTHELSYSDENGTYYFKEYYDRFVNNVGDALYSLTSMIRNNIFDYSYDDYNIITKAKPVIDTNNLVVTEINSHLNNSKAVQKIRQLYTQKQNYKVELEQVQKDIDNINNQLSSLSFEDTSNNRTIYTAQLSQLNEKKQELTTSISSILQEISNNVNETNIPIENAKYHIRGYFDVKSYIDGLGLNINVNKILVQYRYKNQDKITGNATTIADRFLYSDWNIMDSETLKMIPSHNKATYSFTYPESNNTLNEPSFNQIDIPISQGETVDIRLKVVYDLGYPYIETTSDWSDIVNIAFPEEYLKNIQILDIIEENNNDIKKDQFKGVLDKGGYTKHVDDLVVDQDVTYFHHPEYISSGFYTAERRIIPLKDKLEQLNNDVLELKDEVFGTNSEDLQVSIVDGNIETIILPYSENTHYVLNYSDSEKGGYSNQSADETTANLNIKLTNTSDHNVKLFSIFPGDSEKEINTSGRYNNLSDYKENILDENGDIKSIIRVYIIIKYIDKDGNEVTSSIPQYYNQYLYFRIKDAYTGNYYYSDGVQDNTQNMLSCTTDNYSSLSGTGAILYPYPINKEDLTIGEPGNLYRNLKPKESINLPLVFTYKLDDKTNKSISKTISFDIRTSLYNEPTNYKVAIKANYDAQLEDKIKRAQNTNSTYRAVVIDK